MPAPEVFLLHPGRLPPGAGNISVRAFALRPVPCSFHPWRGRGKQGASRQKSPQAAKNSPKGGASSSQVRRRTPRRGEQGREELPFALRRRFPPGAQGNGVRQRGVGFAPGKRRGSFEETGRRSHGGSPFPVFLHDFPRRMCSSGVVADPHFLGGPHGAAVFRCGVRAGALRSSFVGCLPQRNCSSSQSKSTAAERGGLSSWQWALAPLSLSKT